jgi:AraC-like DNA-binding protein
MALMLPGRGRAGFQESTEPVRLIAGVDRIGLCGRFATVSRHHHAAPVLVIGMDGPLRFIADRTHESRAVMIAPGFSHAVDPRGGRLAMFVLPAHAGRADRGPPLRDLPDWKGWMEIGEAVYRQQLLDFAAIDRLVARQIRNLEPIDDRLRAALELVTRTSDTNLAIDEVASAVSLSASRLMNLANAQLGTSLRTYRRWVRAFHVARAFAAGESLTDAAYAAGFSSSAHLSAATREHFGVRPSDVVNPHHRAAIRIAQS